MQKEILNQTNERHRKRAIKKSRHNLSQLTNIAREVVPLLKTLGTMKRKMKVGYEIGV